MPVISFCEVMVVMAEAKSARRCVVVIAADAGLGTGADRKLTMHRDGAIKLLRAQRPSVHRITS